MRRTARCMVSSLTFSQSEPKGTARECLRRLASLGVGAADMPFVGGAGELLGLEIMFYRRPVDAAEFEPVAREVGQEVVFLACRVKVDRHRVGWGRRIDAVRRH